MTRELAIPLGEHEFMIFGFALRFLLGPDSSKKGKEVVAFSAVPVRPRGA
jgi:hypothetical protein